VRFGRTSGITANPAVGRCFDWLIENNAAASSRNRRLIGCEASWLARHHAGVRRTKLRTMMRYTIAMEQLLRPDARRDGATP